MVDIAYRACSVAHCEIVVTEKQWAHELGASGLLELHTTRVLHDIAGLPQVLVDMVR